MMKFRSKILAAILIMCTYTMHGQDRYQHSGTATSMAGGKTVGVGLENTIVAGEAVIGPFSGGVYQGDAGFLNLHSDCVIPVDLTVTNITDVSADIAWTTLQTVLSYSIRYKIEGNAEWTYINQPAASINLTGLESGMPYRLQVVSVCTADGFRKSGWSDLLQFETTGLSACITPGNVSITNITETTADISWDADPTHLDYIVKYKANGAAAWITETVGSATALLSLTTLVAGTDYEVTVQADCAGDGSFLSPYADFISFTTAGALSCAPTSLPVATVVSETEIDLNWAAVPTATLGYHVLYKLSSSAAWNLELVTTGTSLAIVGLLPGSEYQFRVNSICDNNGYAESDIAMATTNGVFACNTITAITEVSNTDDGTNAELSLSWSAEASAFGYMIRYRTLGAIDYTYENTGSNQATLSALFMGTPYQVGVRTICAEDGSIMSGWSDTFSFITSGALSCETPGAITATPDPVNTDQVTIDWNAVSVTFDNYEVQYKVKGTATWITESPVVNMLDLAGLEPGLTYQYRLRTVCNATLNFASGWSITNEFTSSGPSTCEVPTGLVATTIDANTTEVTWNTVASAVDYRLRYRFTGTAAWSWIPQTTNLVTFEGLGGTIYEFQVRSNCDAEGSIISDYSGSIYLDVIGSITCDPVTGFGLVSSTETTLTINWGASSGSYELSYKPASANVYTTINVNSIESYMLTGLTAGTDYNVRIRAYCSVSGIYSEYSQEVFATIGASVCEQATNVTAKNITDTGFGLTWAGTAQSGQFEVKYKPTGGLFWTDGVFGANEALISGLQPSTEYIVYIFNWCANNIMTSSTTFYVTTSGVSNCSPAPSNLSLTSITATTATVSWEGTGDASAGDLYHVQLKPDGSSSWEAIQGEFSWANFHDMTPLTPATQYLFRVRKHCATDVYSAFSDVFFFTTGSAGGRIAGGSTSTVVGSRSSFGENSITDIGVYPNPFESTITINYMVMEKQQVNIDILDLSGQVVNEVVRTTQSAGSYRFNKDLSELSTGVYLVRILYNADSPVYQRIIKQ